MRRHFNGAAVTFAAILAGCSTGDKKDQSKEPVAESQNDDQSRREDDSGEKASSSRVTLTNSLSNNPLTSHTINTGKAEALVGRFDGKSKGAIEGRVFSERLARKGAAQVLATAKNLAEAEMEKGASKTVDDDIKLEVALAAVQSKNFSLAEYFLQDLTDSKIPKIKAAAYNAMGVVALKDDRVPEAVLYFKEALKAVNNYRPALMNLGFAALKGGDLDTAKKALGDLQGDWFVDYGLLTVARLEGNEGRASDLCDKVLGKEPNHKAALYNCALLEYQNRKNFGKARALADKAGKASGGETAWDEKAITLASEIDVAEAEQKRAEAEKRQAEKAKEKAKETPAASGGEKPADGAPAVP